MKALFILSISDLLGSGVCFYIDHKSGMWTFAVCGMAFMAKALQDAHSLMPDTPLTSNGVEHTLELLDTRRNIELIIFIICLCFTLLASGLLKTMVVPGIILTLNFAAAFVITLKTHWELAIVKDKHSGKF